MLYKSQQSQSSFAATTRYMVAITANSTPSAKSFVALFTSTIARYLKEKSHLNKHPTGPSQHEAMPANGKRTGRFELPALTPISYSLTDGTDIPPPAISPIEETAPPPPTTAKSESTQNSSVTSANGHNGTPNGVYDGRGRTSTAEVAPLSPVSTTRPSSIRRLFSRKALNNNYTNETNGSDEHLDASKIARPESSLSFLDRPGIGGKMKSGGWFKRLGGSGASNRSSAIFEHPPKSLPVQAPVQAPAKKGPPPPKLPELNQLKAKVQSDDGGLGGEDMFKNIK